MKIEKTNEEVRQLLAVMESCREKGKLGYAIARNTRRMKDAAKEYIELWNKTFKKYATKNKYGQLTISDEEEQEKFQKDLDGVDDITVEFDAYMVDEDIFQAGELNSKQMESLLWMIKEAKEE